MTYQVITELGWNCQFNLKSESLTENETENLKLAMTLIIAAVDELAHSEINEIFLESIPEVLSWIKQSDADKLLLAQVSVLLDLWLERGRPCWPDLIENLTRALSILKSFKREFA